MTLDDHLRPLSMKDQVAALRSYLLHAERERDEARAVARELFEQVSAKRTVGMGFILAHPWLKEANTAGELTEEEEAEGEGR